jgi:cobalt/nickel transport system permease protein
MDTIDRYAHSNAIRCLDPAQKAGLALLAMGLCLALDRPAVGVLAVAWMLGLTVGWARVPAPVFGRAVLGQGLFLVASSACVALEVGLGAAPAGVWALRAGPLWVGAGAAGLATAARLIARALGCASALNFLILTTPLVDMIELLRRLRAPEALIDLMALTYRAIFVLLAGLNPVRGAQGARPGRAGMCRGIRGAAQLAGQLFLDASGRGARLRRSLESRGMVAALRALPPEYRRGPGAWWLAGALAASLLLAGVVR